MSFRRSQHLLRAYRTDLLVAVAYLLIAVFGYSRLWLASGPVSQANSSADPGLSMWFLTYLPYALLHGHNPLFTYAVNAPFGVNLMDNTSVITPALLVAPVTLLFGPVAAYVTAMTLSLATSAIAAYVLLRRWTQWRGVLNDT